MEKNCWVYTAREKNRLLIFLFISTEVLDFFHLSFLECDKCTNKCAKISHFSHEKLKIDTQVVSTLLHMPF